MLVLEDETEDLIQRFSAVSLMDCGKYADFCRLLITFANLCSGSKPFNAR